METCRSRIVIAALAALAAATPARADDPAPPACPACGCCPAATANQQATAPAAAATPTTRPSDAKAAPATPATPAIPSPPGRGMGMGMGRGMMGGGPGGMGMGNANVMGLIHTLLGNHDKITRTVREIPGGVETTTTSPDAATARDIRTHVRQMKQRMEAGRPIRMWDPLFVELFRHHDKVKMEVADVPGGVRVTETSDDPQVTLLIRQHATRGVDEFVARGWDRAHQPTTLPAGYRKPG
jgi:hypothetical protein